MKIWASIEVARVDLTTSTYTFSSELMLCDAVKVMRTRADRYRKRYYYSARIKRPARMHPDAHSYERDGLVTVGIVRRQNAQWVPPAFPEGAHSVDV